MARWGARVFEGKDVLAPHGTNSGPSPVSLLEPVQVDERRVRQPLLRCHRQGHARQLAQLLLRPYDAGFVSVDKPPLGFWIQATSAYLFGFHGWSLLLPQALAGVLSVALLYHLVGRSFGPVAGLLAALALALTPISVATDRSNNLESLLVLAVVLAAWAFILAVETGRLRWLVVGGLVMGLLGFNIKMLEAFLVLPAFYLLYLVAAPVGWRRRMTH